MLYTRFVQVGRVVLCNYGEDSGKLATIIDVIDQNKCLVDGDATGRKVMSYKRLALTDHRVIIPRNARAKTLKAAWAKAEIQKKWDESSWATKLANKAKRAGLNDFGRFKVMVARKQKIKIVKAKMASMK